MNRRIGLVIPALDAVGGAERMGMALAEGLARAGWAVTVLALSGDLPAERRELLHGVDFVSLGMRKAWIDPRGWRRFRAWQKAARPDVLHGHLAHGAWFVRAAKIFGTGRAVVVDTLHSTRFGGRWSARIYRWTRGLTDGTTAVSGAVRDAAMSAGIAERVCVVRNGIDLEGFRGAVSGERAEFAWLAVGRLEAVKDYRRLLRAFAEVVRQTEQPVRLEIVGDGSERAKLERLAKDLEIDGRICWRGFLEDVREAYAGADAVVLASKWEGLPVCLMEAGATGLPVVTTASAGALEIVLPEQTGMVVPLARETDGAAKNDPLAEAMLRMMKMDGAARAAMGEAARGRVEAEFRAERMVSGYEALYCELLERGSRRRK